jgi:hypothetical protein
VGDAATFKKALADDLHHNRRSGQATGPRYVDECTVNLTSGVHQLSQ